MMQFVIPKRFLFVLLGAIVLVAAGVFGYVYLPKAIIVIEAQISERSVEQEIILTTYIDEPDFLSFRLPTRIVERSLEANKEVKRESVNKTDDFAKGVIVLINDQNEDQPLLPNTHLRHEQTGEYFLTDTPATIPAHDRQAMSITAKVAGVSGNVPPGRFIVDKLPPSVQALVYGESTQAFTGGNIIETPLTEEEIGLAKDQLLEEARGQLLGELTAEARGANLRSDLIGLEVEEESVSAEPGSKASEFAIRMRIKGRAFTVNENDVLSLTLLALRTSVGTNEEFVSYRPESFSLTVENVNYDRGEVILRGMLMGNYAKKVGPTVLNGENVAGLSVDEVREHFRQYPEVGKVDVSFSPFWVFTVPARSDAVDIALKESI